jgi:hypothetical protein
MYVCPELRFGMSRPYPVADKEQTITYARVLTLLKKSKMDGESKPTIF